MSTNHKGSAFGTDSRFSLGPPGTGAYPVWVRSQLWSHVHSSSPRGPWCVPGHPISGSERWDACFFLQSFSLILDGPQSSAEDLLKGESKSPSCLSLDFDGSWISPLVSSLQRCLCPLLADQWCEELPLSNLNTLVYTLSWRICPASAWLFSAVPLGRACESQSAGSLTPHWGVSRTLLQSYYTSCVMNLTFPDSWA